MLIVNEKDIRDELRSLVAALGSRTATARRLRISRPYLTDVLNGNRAPGPKILRALGLKKSYEKVA